MQQQQQLRESSKTVNEVARITYLPDSRLYAWLDQFYADEIEWRVNGSPHEETAANIVAALEADQIDPLEHDWNGLEDSDLTALWSDLGFPLPTDADEMAHSCYGVTPSDMARAALAEYARMYDVEAAAAAALTRLRAVWDEELNSSSN